MDKPTKILIATGIFPPDIGGPATYADKLCHSLPALGCQVSVVTYSDDPTIDDTRTNVKVFKISRQQNILSRYWQYFTKVLSLAKQADIVYVLDLVSAGFPATLSAKLKGKPVVFRTGGDFLWEKACQSNWTDLPLTKYYQAKKNWQEKILLAFGKCIMRKMTLIIFSTQLQADIYKKYYNIPDEKIKIVANPLPKLNIPPANERLGNSIIFAGRLVKLKNISRLIKAFSKINTQTKLLIYGQGPEKSNLETLVDKLKLTERIRFMGNVSQDRLLQAITSCQFVISPSWSEISPNLALECLAMAKPIILTQETGLSAKITANLITIDPMNQDDIKVKMTDLLQPEKLAQYSQKLKNSTLPQWSWAEVAQNHCQLFNQIKNK